METEQIMDIYDKHNRVVDYGYSVYFWDDGRGMFYNAYNNYCCIYDVCGKKGGIKLWINYYG